MTPREHSALGCAFTPGQTVSVKGSTAQWTVELVGWFGAKVFVTENGEGRSHARWRKVEEVAAA